MKGSYYFKIAEYIYKKVRLKRKNWKINGKLVLLDLKALITMITQYSYFILSLFYRFFFIYVFILFINFIYNFYELVIWFSFILVYSIVIF